MPLVLALLSFNGLSSPSTDARPTSVDWFIMMIGLRMPSLWHHQHCRRRPSQAERSTIPSASNSSHIRITELGPSDLHTFLSVQVILGFILLFSSATKNKPLHAGTALLRFSTVSGSMIPLPSLSHCHSNLSLSFFFVYPHIQTVRTDTLFLVFSYNTYHLHTANLIVLYANLLTV